MSAESDLYDALANDVNVTAVVGTKIYSDIREQETDIPAITFEKTGVEFGYTLDSNIPATTMTSFSVACYQATREKAEALSDYVITALTSVGFRCLDDQSDYDSETDTYMTTIQFDYLEVN